MANKVYPKWLEARLQSTANAALDGSGTTGVYVALIDTSVYTYSASHEFFSSLAGAIVGTDQELTSKTFTGGLLDAADTTHPSVSGASVEALVLYVKNAGANTTWRLFMYLDTGVSGLPITPSGVNIPIAWNAAGIVQL